MGILLLGTQVLYNGTINLDLLIIAREKAKWTMEHWKRISGGRPFLLKGTPRTHIHTSTAS